MAITITLPTPKFTSPSIIAANNWPRVTTKFSLVKTKLISPLRKLIKRYLHFSFSSLHNFTPAHSPAKGNLAKLFGRSPFGRQNKLAMIGIVTMLLLTGMVYGYYRNHSNAAAQNSGQTNSESKNLAEATLNRSFTFKSRNAQGLPSGEVKFIITKVEKTKEVLVQGRPANAKGDKAFLVLNIEIENAAVDKAYILPVDLLRLLGDGDKKYAPDIHSDIVEIQPISTKVTRVGFVVFEKQQNFKIQVGELAGEKEVLDVSF